MRKPDVVGGEVTSVHLESRIVVGRRRPLGKRRSRLEVATTPEAVALGHLATHVDDLAIPGKLPEDSANSQGLELLHWSFSSVRCRWSSCLRVLPSVVHARALSPRRWLQTGLWSPKAYRSVGLNATAPFGGPAGLRRRLGVFGASVTPDKGTTSVRGTGVLPSHAAPFLRSQIATSMDKGRAPGRSLSRGSQSLGPVLAAV